MAGTVATIEARARLLAPRQTAQASQNGPSLAALVAAAKTMVDARWPDLVTGAALDAGDYDSAVAYVALHELAESVDVDGAIGAGHVTAKSVGDGATRSLAAPSEAVAASRWGSTMWGRKFLSLLSVYGYTGGGHLIP